MGSPPKSALFPYTTLFRSFGHSSITAAQTGFDVRDFDAELHGHQGTRQRRIDVANDNRSEEHTSELQSRFDLVCRLLLEKKNSNASDTDSPDDRTSAEPRL